MPKQIVVVASGEDIVELIKNFSSVLPITYRFTREIGQSFQKKIGISLFQSNIDWVMLLDDDLLVNESTIKLAKKEIDFFNSNSLAGIGMNVLEPEVKQKFRFRIIQLMNYKLGRISKFGNVTHYMGHKRIKTEWLNGASIWKLSVLLSYDMPLLNSKHAALEDVIFSARVGTQLDLVYSPEIVVTQQFVTNLNLYSLDRFKYMTLWNAYFACIDSRTNFFLYKVITIPRLVKFILKSHGFNKDILKKMIFIESQILCLPNKKEISKYNILDLLQYEINYDNK
jgi:hypothetical protein